MLFSERRSLLTLKDYSIRTISPLTAVDHPVLFIKQIHLRKNIYIKI